VIYTQAIFRSLTFANTQLTIKPGGIGIYPPESLLQLLPRFVGTEGLYLARKFPQREASR
jgi:hypothetical protein